MTCRETLNRRLPMCIRRSSEQITAQKMALFLVVLVLLFSVMWSLHAEELDVQPFDLPAQRLETSLSIFSEQTGFSVLVNGDLLEGKFSKEVMGQFSPRTALEKLLEGTGLAVKYSGTRAFTLMLVHDGGKQNLQMPQSEHFSRTSFGMNMQSALTRYLCAVQPDQYGRYRVVFQLWIGKDGRTNEVRLVESTGKTQRDTELLTLLRRFDTRSPPPASMSQPITILLMPRHDPAKDCRRIAAK